MRTGANIFYKTIISFLLCVIFFSCSNKVEKETRIDIDTAKEVVSARVDSALIIFEEKRKILSERITMETEKIDMKLQELKEKQKKSTAKIKTEIQEDVDELKIKRERLSSFLKNFGKITKDNWRNYENDFEKILEENKKSKSEKNE